MVLMVEQEIAHRRAERLGRLGALPEAGPGMVERARRLFRSRRRVAGVTATGAPVPTAPLVPGTGELAGQ